MAATCEPPGAPAKAYVHPPDGGPGEQTRQTEMNCLTFVDIRIDLEKCRVTRAGRIVNLRPLEYRILTFLMANPGKVYSRDQLMDMIWDSDTFINERTIDVHIGRLRRMLKVAPDNDPIRTVRRSGYALNELYRQDIMAALA